MEEIWKPAIYITNKGEIIDFTGLYEISNFGRRKSLEHIRIKNGKQYLYKEKISEYLNTKERYCAIYMCKNGIKYKCLIHRLVLSSFCPKSNTYECINHKDQNTHNNNLNNLEWCTQEYNCNYSDRNEKLSKSVKEYYKKKTAISDCL